MDIPVSKIVICGGLFVLTLLSGVWLSQTGKPYNNGIFTIHKLIALASVIVTGVNLFGLYRVAGMQALLELALIAAGALLCAALFATGALMSINQSGPVLYLRIHQVAPLLALTATGAAIYLLAV